MDYFFVLGNDKRSVYIKEMLDEEKRTTNDIELATYVILPTPFSKDFKTITGTNIACDEIINMCIGKVIFSGAIPKIVKHDIIVKAVAV